MQTNPPPQQKPARILGFDLARALAIFGMVIVNFKVVMGASENGAAWLVDLAGLLDGRAAALFVMLAGVGLSLMSNRARIEKDRSALQEKRALILKRAAFLFIVGLLYTPIWPADILHFYGIYFIFGALLLSAWSWVLWGAGFSFIAIFLLLFIFFDYEAGWNWETLTYTGFWTSAGMLRHIFFNGFHPVFPWAAFLFFGMWVGRLDVRNSTVRRRLFIFGGLISLITSFTSEFMIELFSDSWFESSPEVVEFLLGTGPIPPMPWYMLTAGGTALVVIVICLWLGERFVKTRWLGALVSTGQLALTLYVAHVVLGMGALQALGVLENQTIEFSVVVALLFCGLSIWFSVAWKKHHPHGPLEIVMRKLTG